MNDFVCDKCGACCSTAHPVYRNELWVTILGPCPHLTKDNLCDIYEIRPDICRVKNNFVENKFYCEILREKLKNL